MSTRSSLVRFVLSGAILLAGAMALQANEVRVTVHGMDGKPASGVEVRIEGGGKGVALSGKTDQKGEYVFKKLDAGSYKMTVLAGKPVSFQPVFARAEDPVRVDFDLKAIAAGKKPRQQAYAVEVGTTLRRKWVDLDDKGNIPLQYR
jgi:hypothetical protein